MALILAAASVAAQPPDDAKSSLAGWLREYDTAFESQDVAALARFYAPDVTVYEEGSDSHGWEEYRDNHLGPELRKMTHPVLFHVHHTAQPVGAAGDAFLIAAEPRLRAEVEGKFIDVRMLETLLVVRGQDGSWKILHAHRSIRQTWPATEQKSPPK